MNVGYYNGNLLPLSDIKIPLTDRAVYFGEGVYEALIARGGFLHFPEKHIDRLFSNLSLLGIPFDKSKEELLSLINDVLFASKEDMALIYLQVTGYSERRIHASPKTDRYNLLITVTAAPLPASEKRVKLVTYPDLRYRYCNIKTLNLLPSVLAARYAEKNGADEAVFIRDGVVTECSKSNLFLIKDGIVYTHPNSPLILPGIARDALLSECRRIGIPRREEAFGEEMLYSADALLITSSTRICSIAESINGRTFDEKNAVATLLCEKLHNNFLESCR